MWKIGTLGDRMNINIDETDKKILEHFFTNLDKPVFYTKNLHPEVWALFQARYSRSTEGLREGFIKLLREANVEYSQLRKLFKEGTPGLELKHALEKAIKFMDKWVLGYGHSSIAEGAVVGIGIEGVSILSTKFIETARLCSFIEKSTRYVKFDRGSFYKPKVIKESRFSKDYDYIIDLLFNTYEQLSEPVLEYIKSQTEKDREKNEKAWLRACAARRFDAIRYILPAATKTSFGWTVNARELAHTIRKMLSYPLDETKEIGNLLIEEGEKVLPSLLRHTEFNPYLHKSETVLKDEYIHQVTKEKTEHNDVKLMLAPSKEELSIHLTAAIVYKNSLLSYEEALDMVKKMNDDERINIFRKVTEGLGPHDMPPREFENIHFTWDVLVDYGAFRDIQRHRMMTQSEQMLTTFLGYEIPDDITGAGCEHDYRKAMEEVDKVFREMFEEYPYESQYIIPLGYRKRVLITTNLRQLHHLIRLRSKPHGHMSYRNIVQKMYLILKEQYGEWADSIECNFENVNLGRLKSELKIEGMK